MIKNIFDEKYEILWKDAFEDFSQVLKKLDSQKTKIIIGLSGGTSLNGFYAYINQNKKDISSSVWQKIVFCFLDERLVELTDDDSNYKSVYNNFLKNLVDENFIKDEQIIKIDISDTDFLSKINAEINEIDIALLGVGPDGHVCSLFPNHEGLKETGKRYILVSNSPKPPSDRITISKEFLESIKNVFIFFIGESKKSAKEMFMQNKSECPASIVLGNENVIVVSDIV